MPSGTKFEAFRDTYNLIRKQKDGLANTTVVLSEGDSWFAFPLDNFNLLDVVTTLVPGLYLRLEDNGDEAVQMFRKDGRNLDRIGDHLKHFDFDAVLISAGGNDIVGEHLQGVFAGQKTLTPAAAVELVKAARFDIVRQSYQNLIDVVRKKGNGKVPILAHTYDYPVQLGVPAELDLKGIGLIALLVSKVGDWIGSYVKAVIPQKADQLEFVRLLLDAFRDDILVPLQRANADIFRFCPLLGTLGPDPTLWHDELHPSDAGFQQLGEKFAAQLKTLLATFTPP
jgi:lysophospholipase L1-like esterase